VDVRLGDPHGYPLNRPPARVRGLLGQGAIQFLHASGRDDLGVTVNVKPDEITGEVGHEYADVRVLQDVAQARHDAVAAEFGVGDGALVEHPQETGRPGPEAAVAVAARVARGDERHLHAPDELHHLRGQLVAELAVVELACPFLRAVLLLPDVLAPRSWSRQVIATPAAP
jgi:hypothetical protein